MTAPQSKDISINGILNFEILQPKLDGWFCDGHYTPGKLAIYSKSVTLMRTYDVQDIDYKINPMILRGEYMFGTNRAKNCDQYLAYFVYDIEVNAPYSERYLFLAKFVRDYMASQAAVDKYPQIFLVPNYTRDAFRYLYEEIKLQRLEGIVLRNNSDDLKTIHRFKPRFCINLVVLGMEEGQGRLEGSTGALVGGQFKDGKMVEICKVAGMSDNLRRDSWNNKHKYLGKVFEAEGSQVFEETGSLRHPRFKRWRLDVPPAQVIFGEVRYAE